MSLCMQRCKGYGSNSGTLLINLKYLVVVVVPVYVCVCVLDTGVSAEKE